MLNTEEIYLIENLKVESVLHIGAYVGEELDFYNQWNIKNIVFVEPNPVLYERLCENIKSDQYSHMKLLTADYAMHDIDDEELDFYLYYTDHTNMGCSSLKQSVLHNRLYPQVTDQGIIKVKTLTADSLVKRMNIDFNIDFLNIDVQGNEYEVLTGAKELLQNSVKGILVETAFDELYKNQKYQRDITIYLEQFGFKLNKYFPHDNLWGDTYYVKEV